jgi:hypothetical protein
MRTKASLKPYDSAREPSAGQIRKGGEESATDRCSRVSQSRSREALVGIVPHQKYEG